MTITLTVHTTAADVIPGVPSQLWDDAWSLRGVADTVDTVAADLGRIDVGPWEGRASDGYRATIAMVRARLVDAVDAYRAAADALRTHGDVLSAAQRAAQEHIGVYLRDATCAAPGAGAGP